MSRHNGELFEVPVKPESRKDKRAKQLVVTMRHRDEDRVTMEELWLENSSSIETKSKHWSASPARAACGQELGPGEGVVLVEYVTCFDCQRAASEAWRRLTGRTARSIDEPEEEE